jgi:hypothetical protein
MSKYIINSLGDIESKITIFSIFGEETKRILLLYNNYLTDDDWGKIYWRLNSFFEVNKLEFISAIKNAKSIPKNEIYILDKYCINQLSFDVVDYILELLYNRISETNNTHLLKKLDQLDQRD